MDLRSFVQLMARRRRMVVATVVGVFAVAVAVGLLLPERYRASATMRARTTLAVLDGEVRFESLEYMDRLGQTYTDIAASPSFRAALQERLGADADVDPFVEYSTRSELFEVGVETDDRSLAVPGAEAAAVLLLEQIEAQDQEAIARGQERFDAAKSRLEAEIAALETQLATLPAGSEADAERTRIEAALASRREEATAASSEFAGWRRQQIDRSSALSMVTPPGPEVERLGAPVPVLAGTGLLAGLVAGVGVVLVGEKLRDETDSSREIAELLGAAWFGDVRLEWSRRRDPLRENMHVPEGLAVAALRLTDSPSDGCWMIVSDVEIAGRAVSAGLARAMHRLGYSVATVDGARPVDAPAGQGPIPDLLDVLAGDATLDAARLTPSEADVPVFALTHHRGAGRRAPLTPPLVHKALAQLRERHDAVVVHAPSLDETVRWTLLSTAIDKIILAVVEERVPRDEVRGVGEQVEAFEGTVVGVVGVNRRRIGTGSRSDAL